MDCTEQQVSCIHSCRCGYDIAGISLSCGEAEPRASECGSRGEKAREGKRGAPVRVYATGDGFALSSSTGGCDGLFCVATFQEEGCHIFQNGDVGVFLFDGKGVVPVSENLSFPTEPCTTGGSADSRFLFPICIDEHMMENGILVASVNDTFSNLPVKASAEILADRSLSLLEKTKVITHMARSRLVHDPALILCRRHIPKSGVSGPVGG